MAHGRAFTVASASGGCGKTFLATNLAWFLAHHGHRRVCLVDLDLRFGEVSRALRFRPEASVADLVVPQDLDLDLGDRLEHCVATHPIGIQVLAAPANPAEAGRVRPSDVLALIAAARDRFDDIVIDTPPTMGDLVAAAVDASDQVVVMATPDVPSLRNLRVFLGTLDRRRIPRSRLQLVLNRTEEVDAGVLDLLEDFGRDFDAVIPQDRAVERALQIGRPVMASDPAAPVSRRLGEAFRSYLPPDEQLAYDAFGRARDPRRHRPRRWWRHDQTTR